jgi:fibronectin-binding autotransporter adhesin
MGILSTFGLMAGSASAATLIWDSVPNSGNGVTDGNGTWDALSANWWNPALGVDLPWVSGATAQFGSGNGGSNPYTVTVNGLALAGGLVFQNQSYSLSSGTLNLVGSSPTVTVNAAQAEIDSPITGSSGLTKAGAGYLLLTGASVYSGATTISKGTLDIGGGGSLGPGGNYAGNISITKNAALNFDSTASQTFSGVISGQGSMTKTGPGMLTITNVNSFGRGDSASDPLGVATIDQGEVQVQPGGALTNNGTEIDVGDTSGMMGMLMMTGGSAMTPWSSYAKSGVNVGMNGGRGVLTLMGNSLVDASCTANGSFNAIAIGLPSSIGTVTVADTSELRAVNGDPVVGSYLTVGEGGTGTLTVQDQGLVQAANFYLGSTFYGVSGGTGTLYLNGGTLSVPQVVNNQNTTGTLFFNGGVLQATADSSDFISAGGTLNTYVQTGGAIIDSNGNTITVNQPLLHASNGSAVDGGLTKVGNGTLVLTAVNTYTGPTTVQQGVLQLGTGAAGQDGIIQSPTIELNDGTTLTYNLAGPQTYSGVISGPGTVMKTGIGSITLAGANTYSGGTIVSQGILSFANTGAQPSAGTTSVAAGATLALGVGTASGYFTSANLDALFANALPNVTLDPASNVGIDTTVGDFTYTSSIPSTSLGLTKIGPNRLTLTGANAYSGQTIVGGGILTVAGNGSLGGPIFVGEMGAGTLTIQDQAHVQATSFALGSAMNGVPGGTGTLFLNGGILSVPQIVNDSGTTGQLYFNGGVLQNTANSSDFISPSGTLTAYIQTGGAVIDSNDGRVTINQPLLHDGSGPAVDGGLTKIGDGTLILTSVNTYTGVTTVQRGVLQLGNGAAGQEAIIQSASVVLNPGTALVYDLASMENFSGVISGSGTVVKTGPGTITLAGANSYSGGTVVNQGTLTFANTAAQPASGTTIVAAGATLALEVGAPAGYFNSGNLDALFANALPNVSMDPASSVGIDTTPGDYTYASSAPNKAFGLTKLGPNTLTLTGPSVYTGPTTIEQGILQVGTGAAGQDGVIQGPTIAVNAGTSLAYNLAGAQTYSGVISGSGAVTKTGIGSITLAGANTYSGGTVVNQGVLSFANTAAQPVAGTTIVAAGATLALGVGTANGYFTSANLDSLFANALPNVSLDPASNVGIDTTGGDFTYASSIPSTTLGLSKIGPNTLTLSGTNSYTGPTTILGGALAVSSSRNLGAGNLVFGGGELEIDGRQAFHSSEPILLDQNGTLQVSGGTAMFSGPLSGNGILTTGGPGMLVLSGANNLGEMDVTGGKLVLANPSAIAGGSSLIVGGNAASLFAPATAQPSLAVSPAIITAVPEPGTMALMAAAFAAGLGIAARRKRPTR